MADTINLAAEVREEFGKGASRRIRRQHKIPAVLYGKPSQQVYLFVLGQCGCRDGGETEGKKCAAHDHSVRKRPDRRCRLRPGLTRRPVAAGGMSDRA